VIINEGENKDSLYRPVAKDIRPLISFGVESPTDWMKKNKDAIKYLESSLKEA
jgi:hypothetical protein